MNSWMGNRHMDSYSNRGGYRTFLRDSEIAAAGPATLWVIIDENESSIDDGWFLVTMDDSRPFGSVPTTRHQQGYALNFADGHTEVYRWRGAKNRSGTTNSQDPDWVRLQQVTTTR